MEIKKEYEDLREKYGLPKFSYMDDEFEISAIKIPDSGIFIKAVLRSVINKYGICMNFFEPVISPQQTMHSMIELSGLTEEDKKNIYQLYKKMGFIIHEMYLSEIKDEKSVSEQINLAVKSWETLKKEVIKNLDIINKSWAKKDMED